MTVYGLIFPDSSIYIGVARDLKKRISNHKAIWRTGRSKTKKVYQKMSQFKGEFEVKILKECKTLDEMYEAEMKYIKIFKSECLNNSIGGRTPKGRVNKRIKRFFGGEFKGYCLATKSLKYFGDSPTDCAKALGCSVATVMYQLNNTSKPASNNRKYIINKVGGASCL